MQREESVGLQLEIMCWIVIDFRADIYNAYGFYVCSTVKRMVLERAVEL